MTSLFKNLPLLTMSLAHVELEMKNCLQNLVVSVYLKDDCRSYTYIPIKIKSIKVMFSM